MHFVFCISACQQPCEWAHPHEWLGWAWRWHSGGTVAYRLYRGPSAVIAFAYVSFL